VLQLEPNNKSADLEVLPEWIGRSQRLTEGQVKNVWLIGNYVSSAKEAIEANDPKKALRQLDMAAQLTTSKKIELLRAEAILGLKEYDRAIQIAT
jgi:hypothetical protein